MTHLRSVGAGEYGAVVAAGFVEELGPAAAHRFVAEALAAVGTGAVVVATADPADRDVVERELRAGRGLSPATWAHLFDRAGVAVELVETGDRRMPTLVVARAR